MNRQLKDHDSAAQGKAGHGELNKVELAGFETNSTKLGNRLLIG